MTKAEFVEKVKAIMESGKLEKLDDLYEEVLGYHEKQSYSAEDKTTIRWGTP